MKKWLYKILKITGILVLVVLIISAYLVFMTGPELPERSLDIIDSIADTEVPEFVKGDTGYILADGYRIWYESVTPEDRVRGTALLFMGISNDALGWPQKFIDNLVESGYRVVRFDYRDTGLSDWINGSNRKDYSLEDLAHDAVLILDSLGVEKAHLVGISLGGMVAQDFAIHFPERTETLSSVMSSGYITDPELPGINMNFVLDLVKNNIKYSVIPTEKNILKRNVAVRILLRGDALYDVDVEGISQQVLYNTRKRNGYNTKASRYQQEAVMKSGSRYEQLKNLDIPVLIIHGMNDPFIPIEHSRKLASIIDGADTLWIENMGHDVPPYLIDSMTGVLVRHFARGEREKE
jgi:pimeloyl-ACP methyl ester carboxylesterase